ncbi:MAG TPA: hypothetical protein VFS00_20295, partial [Polyangiaceae bacterium]|nr:hypothetical protein [Polyangiaceae bacterium]
MERPTSEKVALLERVLNRIRENARDTSSRSHFSRGATEPRKGVPAARPSVPPPTVAFPADQLPDATPLAAAAAVSPPPPAVAAAPSPRPPAVAAAPSPPPPAVAAAPSPPPPAVVAAPPPPPPVLAADAAIVLDVPGLSSIDDAPTPESVDALPASGQTRLVSTEDLDVLRSGHEASPPGGPRATQAYGQPEAPQVDVAFDERQAEARAPSAPPPSPPSSPAPSAPDLGNDVTGVRPIAPAAAGAARMPPGSFGGPPFEVDLASTIELPASELASAVHSSADEEAPAPASSPRLRSSLSDDDTYPAVSPSSLPPARGASGVAAEARSEVASDLPDAAVEPAADSQVGMRAPSVAPAGTS